MVEVPQPPQPSAAATSSGSDTDPAKVAEFQRRFQEGYILEQQGKLTEARAIYDGILAELNPGSLVPHARVMEALRLLCEDVMPKFK